MLSRRTARHLILLIGVLVLIQATILTAAGRSLPSLLLAHRFMHPELSWQLDVPSAKKSCSKMEVSDPALWFDVDENGDPDLDTPVDSYPSEVVAIVAGFEYNCVPAKTAVTAIFYSLNYSGDKPWHTSEIKLAPTDKPGVLWRGVRFKDRRPIPDGDYRVEFFLGKQLLSTGEVTVGVQEDEEEQEQTEEPGQAQEEERRQGQEREERRRRDDKVQIEGRIIDGGTQQPIKGAAFIVLNPGVTVAQWADYGYPPSDILTTNKTDRTGRFRQPGVERGVEYSVVVWALSYSPWYHDGFMLGDDDPDPYPLTIELYR
jgi:hypothetical protein